LRPGAQVRKSLERAAPGPNGQAYFLQIILGQFRQIAQRDLILGKHVGIFAQILRRQPDFDVP